MGITRDDENTIDGFAAVNGTVTGGEMVKRSLFQMQQNFLNLLK